MEIKPEDVVEVEMYNGNSCVEESCVNIIISTFHSKIYALGHSFF
jgi:hypothetical protein